jgi:catechol 2,3-dioxygenase-like lactoylglutathione lyase family enzyme
MFKKIDHIEIVPTGINRTIEFYVSVLGFTIKERFPVPLPPLKEIAYLVLGGTVIELISVEKPAAAPRNPWQVGYRAIAIEVDDMDATVNYLKTKGIAITWGPMASGNSIRAEIHDPDGLPIELRQ